MDILKDMLATLPQMEKAKETKQVLTIISHLNCISVRISLSFTQHYQLYCIVKGLKSLFVTVKHYFVILLFFFFQLIVKAAYHSVTRAYLQCLMQRKYKHLEKRWNDVEKKIMGDAEFFYSNFPQQVRNTNVNTNILYVLANQCCIYKDTETLTIRKPPFWML